MGFKYNVNSVVDVFLEASQTFSILGLDLYMDK